MRPFGVSWLSTPATQTYDAALRSVKSELYLSHPVTSNSGNSFSTFFRPSSEAKIERSLILVTEKVKSGGMVRRYGPG